MIPTFFIVGMPRSGTTLLSFILDAHTQIAVAPETHYFTKFHDNITNPREILEKFKSSKYADNLMIDNWNNMNISTSAELFLSLLLSYSKYKSLKYVGEKTPAHFSHLEEIRRVIPSSKVIMILRDPVDIFNSLNKTPWGKTNLWRFYVRLRKYQNIVANAQKRNDDTVFVVKYEELLGSPVKIIKQITSFLEVDFQPKMLEYHLSLQSREVLRDSWKKKNSTPLDRNNTHKWLTQNVRIKEKIILELFIDIYKSDYPELSASIRKSLIYSILIIITVKLPFELMYRLKTYLKN